MPPNGVCFFSLHVLPFCAAAGWCPCWRCCQPEQQPWRPSQRQLHIQRRSQPPAGNIQRFDAHCSPIICLTQHDMDSSQFVFTSYFCDCLQQVLPPPWLAMCPPAWSWRWRNRTRMRCMTTSPQTIQMMRVTEETRRPPEEAHARGENTSIHKLNIFQKGKNLIHNLVWLELFVRNKYIFEEKFVKGRIQGFLFQQWSMVLQFSRHGK